MLHKTQRVIVVLLALTLALPLAALAQEAGKVRVITSHSQAAKCIAPVRVKKIDGREATVQRMGFNIEPGRHTISGSAIIDTSACPTIGRVNNPPRAAPLEADFELGKVYYLGYDHSSTDRNDWKIVIWKVEDAEG